ncbi:phospho-2-dehydro-3-deoxyheptonate aldolase [mine drainage metagenome]|uniref:Phospho-2-dehydro-3-deoxyheptonate aldolase n=1 Tax=mine drainage metagenome TaxID=410659 RepID=T1CCY7_9ZZZZ
MTELLDPGDLDDLLTVTDIIQIGSRNSQNFPMLRKVGRTGKPVLFKRGFGNTIDEFLNAAKYITREGNNKVILAERGIRTFEPSTRFTLEISAVPVIQERVDLPVIVDPSHPAGIARYVAPLSRAAVAVGSDGLMIEVHPDPPRAKSDSQQQLDFNQFKALKEEIDRLLQHAIALIFSGSPISVIAALNSQKY